MKKLVTLLLFVLFLFANDINLNIKEVKFIKNHTFKCITTNTWAPFNTAVNGKLTGISVDFWKIVKKKLNLKSKCIVTNNWSTVLDTLKNNQADLTIGTDKTAQKEKLAIFTEPYATFPIAIATRNNVGYIASMEFLKDKKIVAGRNYTAYHILKKHFPNYKIIEVDNIKKALKMVSENKAYAAIDIMPVLVYNINKYEFANLKIAGKTPWKFKMRFMLTKNNALLASALNKAIKTITPEQKKEIYKKWIFVTYTNGYSFKEILMIVSIFIAIIIILTLWVSFLIKEINKRKKIEKELRKISILDPLTGVFNRYKINSSLQQQISFFKRHRTPLCVIFFDIDNFKKINDTYGHQIGDEILKQLTLLIKQSLRKYDIFGRWGGEEFIIILPNTDLKQAVKVAKKLKSRIENHIFKNVKKVTCSFGVTELYDKDNDKSVINRVDTFLYEAKKRGKNQIISDLNF